MEDETKINNTHNYEENSTSNKKLEFDNINNNQEYDTNSQQNIQEKSKNNNNKKIIYGIIGLVIIIALFFLIFGGSSSTNVKINNISENPSMYIIDLSVKTNKDMPNARVTIKIYDNQGNYLGEYHDALLQTNNFVGGNWYQSKKIIYSRYAGGDINHKISYVEVQIANNYDLESYEVKLNG